MGKVMKKFGNKMPKLFIARKYDLLATVITIFSMKESAAMFTQFVYKMSQNLNPDAISKYRYTVDFRLFPLRAA